ncbi:MAG: hypothetical protein QM237_04200 [Bacteroidota bacterium]|jgi:hypothetical protein|nr:hypothetical protein [Bacteroidota bacterium]
MAFHLHVDDKNEMVWLNKGGEGRKGAPVKNDAVWYKKANQNDG